MIRLAFVAALDCIAAVASRLWGCFVVDFVVAE
jgi:hypothetical protein